MLLGLCLLVAAGIVVIVVGLVTAWRRGGENPVPTALNVDLRDQCSICGRDFHARGCPVPAVLGVCALPWLLVTHLVFMVAALVQDRVVIDFGYVAFGLVVFDSLLLWYAPRRGRFHL